MSLSSNADPVTFSIEISMSPVASPPEYLPATRLIDTAALDRFVSGRVDAGAAVNAVGPGTAGQQVVARAADEAVRAGARVEHVVRRVPGQHVGEARPDDVLDPDERVRAGPSTGAAEAKVDGHAGGSGIISRGIAARTAVEVIVTRTAIEAVVAVVAVEPVIAPEPEQRVIEQAADEQIVEIIPAGQGRGLRLGNLAEVGRIVDLLRRHRQRGSDQRDLRRTENASSAPPRSSPDR